ncbi:hypothetical protein MAR_028315, partial [Mya arenaria]
DLPGVFTLAGYIRFSQTPITHESISNDGERVPGGPEWNIRMHGTVVERKWSRDQTSGIQRLVPMLFRDIPLVHGESGRKWPRYRVFDTPFTPSCRCRWSPCNPYGETCISIWKSR